MKYFLPLSIENLSNILSTESVAPGGIYPMRAMGFKFFELIHVSDPADRLRVYEKMPAFETDQGNQPVLILEFRSDFPNAVVKDDLGNLWLESFMFFEPNRDMTIWFVDDQAKESAFNAIAKSIEPKFAKAYYERARIADSKAVAPKETKSLFEVVGESVLTKSNLGDLAKRFEQIDRIKGAIFCFYLAEDFAVQKSFRNDYIAFMQGVDELINLVTQGDMAKLNGVKNALESILFSLALDKAKKENKKIEPYDFNLRKALANFHGIEILIPENAVTNQILLEDLRMSLETRIRSAVRTQSASEGQLTICDVDGNVRISLPGDNYLGDALLNGIIEGNPYVEAGKALGYPFSLICGKVLREHVGESWEDSPVREFVNALLVHLNDHEPLDEESLGKLDEKDSVPLTSLAMFCEREDNAELDDYYRFLLIKHGVMDFRIPFALWGAAFGFSSIPKTMIDDMAQRTLKKARRDFRTALEMIMSEGSIASIDEETLDDNQR